MRQMENVLQYVVRMAEHFISFSKWVRRCKVYCIFHVLMNHPVGKAMSIRQLFDVEWSK
jgi:hypothetical protein